MARGILTGKGINAQRRLLSSRSSVDDELTDLVTSTAPPIMLRAVVVDVIFDNGAISDQFRQSLSEIITNPDFVDRIPRNSIIAQVISNAEARRSDTPALFFPLLSHISQPVKPGEQVWVMFENPEVSTVQGFWLSRIVEPNDVDDPNFTHGDRKFDSRSEPTSVEISLKGSGPDDDQSIPGFPNGAGTAESFSFRDEDQYEKIEKESVSNSIITKEPVPRFKKRPADLVLEGSNNTLIVLGEDRAGPAANITGESISRPEQDKFGQAGTIDIVAGRGRELPSPGSSPLLTAPPVVINSRGLAETDKVDNQNMREGDPDFSKDAARLYISANTAGDTNFTTTPERLPKDFQGQQVSHIDEGSFGVLKADHIRIISRQDERAASGLINGTIRIIKEGVPDDENGKGLGAIIIEPNGTVIIDGPHIVIGSANLEKDHGAGTHVSIGQGATEPLVLGDSLRELLETYVDEIQSAVNTLSDSMVRLSAQSEAANKTPSPGSPLPAVSTINKSLNTDFSKFKSNVNRATSNLKSKVPMIRSKVGKTR